jgi:hypothetical protein
VTIPIQRLYRANVVVNDLRSTARNYARMLGITRWEVRHWTPQRLRDSQAFGYRAEFGYSAAAGSNAHGVTFQLIQPNHGFNTFTEFLITRGEGIHSLCATRLSPPDMDALVAELAQRDLSVAQEARPDDGSASVMLDTRRALGGFFLELASGSGATSASDPDEVWDLSSDDNRPQSVAWLARIPKIGHFGVAVSTLTDKLPTYAGLLGINRWNGIHFHGTPGGLEHSTFDGHVVDNAWLLAITDVADFGLELLQGTREPTDYQRTVQRIGEGIHHVLVRRGLSDSEWMALYDWMASMSIGIVMSGRVRGGTAEFFYLDTREALGGYLLEVIVMREVPDAPAPAANFRFDFDFTNKV